MEATIHSMLMNSGHEMLFGQAPKNCITHDYKRLYPLRKTCSANNTAAATCSVMYCVQHQADSTFQLATCLRLLLQALVDLHHGQ